MKRPAESGSVGVRLLAVERGDVELFAVVPARQCASSVTMTEHDRSPRPISKGIDPQELRNAIATVIAHGRAMREPTGRHETPAELVAGERAYLAARALLRRSGVRVATDPLGGAL